MKTEKTGQTFLLQPGRFCMMHSDETFVYQDLQQLRKSQKERIKKMERLSKMKSWERICEMKCFYKYFRHETGHIVKLAKPKTALKKFSTPLLIIFSQSTKYLSLSLWLTRLQLENNQDQNRGFLAREYRILQKLLRTYF